MKKNIIYTLTYTLLACLLLSSCKDNDAIDPRIQLKTPTTMLIEAKSGEVNLIFHSPKDWTASSDQEWCTLSTTTGAMGDASIVATVEENLTSSVRESIITLLADNLTQTVQISQASHAGASFIRITHSSNKFPVPILTGESFEATIHWGDGQQDKYTEELTHDYVEKQPYHLTMVVWGAEKVKIPSLKDVTEIDFTEF